MWLSDGIADMPWLWQAVIRVGAAAVLGGVIGMERERHGRSAGLRTQMLVALGASLAMNIGLHFADTYAGLNVSGVRVDPTRIAYGVMGGIGFLGGGAILTYGAGVRGLTTAASLWCTAAVGLTCGAGLFELAAIAAGMVFFILLVLRWIDSLLPARWYRTITIELDDSGRDTVDRVTKAILADRVTIVDPNITRNLAEGKQQLRLYVHSVKTTPLELVNRLSGMPGVHRVSIES